jgi:hypothetical protein
MNRGSQTTELIANPLIGNALFACVQIAHASRRQDNSRFLLRLEETQARDPEKKKQNDQAKTEFIAVKTSSPHAETKPNIPKANRFRRSIGPRFPFVGLAMCSH